MRYIVQTLAACDPIDAFEDPSSCAGQNKQLGFACKEVGRHTPAVVGVFTVKI